MSNPEETWWDRNKIWMIPILVLFGIITLIVIIYLIIDENSDNTEIEKKKKYEDLINERNKLKAKATKDRMRNVKVGFFLFRVAIVIGGYFTVTGSISYCYDNPTLEQYLAWMALLGLGFSTLMFILVGIPTDIKTVLMSIKPTIEVELYE